MGSWTPALPCLRRAKLAPAQAGAGVTKSASRGAIRNRQNTFTETNAARRGAAAQPPDGPRSLAPGSSQTLSFSLAPRDSPG